MSQYTVKSGDTLSQIAKSYGVDMWELADANGIRNPNYIRAGQVLTIPTREANVAKALNECLSAIEALPEFKTLSGLLECD